MFAYNACAARMGCDDRELLLPGAPQHAAARGLEIKIGAAVVDEIDALAIGDDVIVDDFERRGVDDVCVNAVCLEQLLRQLELG